MTHLDLFYILKQKILVKYREQYPFYRAEIHQFGNKEIAQLLDLIEKDINERVSEKWVYTHLKPVENNKLPRRDMLDIFSKWTGYNNWDEFIYANTKESSCWEKEEIIQNPAKKKKIQIMMTGAAIIVAIASIVIGFTTKENNEVTVCFKDRYTQKSVEPDKFSLFLLKNSYRNKLKITSNCSSVKSRDKEVLLVVESPYYKSDTIKINVEMQQTVLEFDLQPDDYAMMLRAYMNSDLEDWNKRKGQLDDIISDNAIIQEIMFDEIGVEFLNKKEFIAKVTTPIKKIKQMEIVEIEYEEGKIISLKYMQK